VKSVVLCLAQLVIRLCLDTISQVFVSWSLHFLVPNTSILMVPIPHRFVWKCGSHILMRKWWSTMGWNGVFPWKSNPIVVGWNSRVSPCRSRVASQVDPPNKLNRLKPPESAANTLRRWTVNAAAACKPQPALLPSLRPPIGTCLENPKKGSKVTGTAVTKMTRTDQLGMACWRKIRINR